MITKLFIRSTFFKEEDRYSLEVNEQGNKLVIQYAIPQDRGNYRCQVSSYNLAYIDHTVTVRGILQLEEQIIYFFFSWASYWDISKRANFPEGRRICSVTLLLICWGATTWSVLDDKKYWEWHWTLGATTWSDKREPTPLWAVHMHCRQWIRAKAGV